jgi:hypothetical protein
MHTTDLRHRALVRKFHALCHKAGLTDSERYAIVESFGKESSKNMSISQLAEACDKLLQVVNKKVDVEMDKWRKRTMASVGGYLQLLGKTSNAEIVKGIAERATGIAHFNNIPLDRLRNIYYAFLKKQTDFKMVGQMAETDIELLKQLN